MRMLGGETLGDDRSGRCSSLYAIIALVKETMDSLLTFRTYKGRAEQKHWLSQEECYPDRDSSSTLILDFQPTNLDKIIFCCLEATSQYRFTVAA